MELRVKKSALMLAMGVLVLALAGIGCGDDDGAGAGGTAGTGGTGGTAGTAGTGGTGGGAAPTVAECTTAVGTNTTGVIPAASACASCLCEEEATRQIVIACEEPCWALVNCVRASSCVGMTGPAYFTCVGTECTAELGPGMATASPFSPIVTECASACTPSDIDAGDTDAGN